MTLLSGTFWPQWNHVLSVCQARRWWSTPYQVSKMMVMVITIAPGMTKIMQMSDDDDESKMTTFPTS